MSSSIEKGSRWDDVISDKLETANFGVICLTPESMKGEWILFEAGALSKKFKDARICTYLYSLRESEVTGPLAKFQHTRAEKEDTGRLVEAINRRCDHPISEERLKETFEQWWPKLEAALKAVPPQGERPTQARTDADKLDEVLLEVRELRRLAQPDPQRRYLESLMRAELLPGEESGDLPQSYKSRLDKFVWTPRPAVLLVPDPPKLINIGAFRCKTHDQRPRVVQLAENAIAVDCCCEPFLQEMNNVLSAQRERERLGENPEA
jgi:hypothetical protein